MHLLAAILSGPGAEKLTEGGRGSQFVVLSEEHMVREIPEITTALLRALQPAGYEYLAIESGTIHARMASRAPQAPSAKAGQATQASGPSCARTPA